MNRTLSYPSSSVGSRRAKLALGSARSAGVGQSSKCEQDYPRPTCCSPCSQHATLPTRGREKKELIARRANHSISCPAPFAKIYSFSLPPNHSHNPRRLVPERGDRDRHERGTGCGGRGSARAQLKSQGGVKPVSDRSARRRTVLMRTAKSCGSDASTLASSLVEACRPNRARTRWQSAR